MFVWLPQFSASESIKIVVVRFVDADAVLIADFFGDRRENAAFRRSTGINEKNKSLLKKLTPTQPQIAASTKRTALSLIYGLADAD